MSGEGIMTGGSGELETEVHEMRATTSAESSSLTESSITRSDAPNTLVSNCTRRRATLKSDSVALAVTSPSTSLTSTSSTAASP
jgi:hypothetical protein